ncbi:MAG TPA: aldehyde dehydrogenase family protein [Pseudonocardiaceae bacterium]
MDSEEEAVDLASATRYGLGANVFDADIEHAEQVAARIESGLCINLTVTQPTGLPPRARRTP